MTRQIHVNNQKLGVGYLLVLTLISHLTSRLQFATLTAFISNLRMEYLQQISRVIFITCLFATVSTIHKERETVEKYDNNLIAEKHGLGANAAGDVSVTNEYIILPILVNLPYYDHVYNITQQRNNYSLFLNNFLVQDLKFLDAKSFTHQLKSTSQTKLQLFSVSTHNNLTENRHLHR